MRLYGLVPLRVRARYPNNILMDDVKIADDLLIPAGRHTLAPEEVSARQRERLMRAMGQCVGERGYVETTIADVVRVARTSRTVFYRHFADKEAVLPRDLRRDDACADRRIARRRGRGRGWREKLEAGIGAYFHWMAAHPEVAVTSVVEVHRAGRTALEARSRALADWARTLEGVAVLAREAGQPSSWTRPPIWRSCSQRRPSCTSTRAPDASTRWSRGSRRCRHSPPGCSSADAR